MSDFVVVGDCGGTNTRLSLWEIPFSATSSVPRGQKAPGTLRFEKKYINERHTNFVQILRQFLAESGTTQTPKAACLACAGPILDNTVNFTNIASGWCIDGLALALDLGIPEVQLVNDFTAMGYGLLCLKAEETFVLNDVPPREGGTVATIGAGTGLGECFLSKDPSRASEYVCFATEGGHTDWAPRDDEEFELLAFLRKKFQQKARVSVERVISGPGIANIYEFLAEKYPSQVNSSIQAEFEAGGAFKGGVVAKNADTDALCGKAMQIFFDAYASEAGNAMLKWLPTGGFYLTGGIAAKNLKYIADSPRFKEIMFEKGRVSPAIQQCPVYVTTVEDVGERGAHLVAYNLLLHRRKSLQASSFPSPIVAFPSPVASVEVVTMAGKPVVGTPISPAEKILAALPATSVMKKYPQQAWNTPQPLRRSKAARPEKTQLCACSVM